jgi:hypothetical protein
MRVFAKRPWARARHGWFVTVPIAVVCIAVIGWGQFMTTAGFLPLTIEGVVTVVAGLAGLLVIGLSFAAAASPIQEPLPAPLPVAAAEAARNRPKFEAPPWERRP